MDTANGTPEYLVCAYYVKRCALEPLLEDVQALLATVSDAETRVGVLLPRPLRDVAADRPPAPCPERLSSLLHGSPNRRVTAIMVLAENKQSRRAGSMEVLWQLCWDEEPVAAGLTLEPDLLVSLGLPFVNPERKDSISAFPETLTAAVVRHAQIYHGLVDVGTPEFTGRGTLYEATEPGWMPFGPRMYRAAWIQSQEQRKHRLRGVFWAQVLSSELVQMVGGQSFLEGYRAFKPAGERDLVTVYADGSAMIRVSESPLDVCRPYIALTPNLLERGAWLYERFRAAGIV